MALKSSSKLLVFMLIASLWAIPLMGALNSLTSFTEGRSEGSLIQSTLEQIKYHLGTKSAYCANPSEVTPNCTLLQVQMFARHSKVLN